MNHSIETPTHGTMEVTNHPHTACVGITAIIGGASMIAVTVIAIFSPEHLAVAPWIVGGLSMMGIALGYFSSNSRK